MESAIAALILLASCGAGEAIPASPTTESVPASPSPTVEMPAPTPGAVTFDSPQRYRVEYVVTASNAGFDIDDLVLYQPRPIEWDAQREVQIEEIRPPSPIEGLDPTYGNGIYCWHIEGGPGPGETADFSLAFSLTAYETRTNIDPGDVRPYRQNNPLYALYTRPERFIESTDPRIIDVAGEVAGDETNPYLLARRFYHYVIDNARYQVTGKGLMGARELITTGTGECGDYAALFVALARAKGIPARPIVGYWAISGLEQAHCWAEFYAEPFGWIPVDPTIGQLQPLKQDYYFGNMDNQRVILNKGFNLPLDPPAPDEYVVPFLQVPWWWFHGSGDESAMSLKRTGWTVASVP